MTRIALRYLVAGFLIAFLGAAGLSHAAEDVPDASMVPPVPLNERLLDITGDPDHPVTLEVTFYTPDGPGPFPLAVMNHGASGKPKFNPRYRFDFSTYYFLSRGYAVALPMIRGFAGSRGNAGTNRNAPPLPTMRGFLGGSSGNTRFGCDYRRIGINNAKDIRAVIDYLSNQPNIDGDRVVVAGQSFGGWNTLAFGTLNHPKVRGLINFVGGMKTSDCETPEAAMEIAAKAYGAHTSVPSIWFYGNNDKVFSPPTWRAVYKSYVDAGGMAQLVAFGSFMDNAHNLLGFPEGLAIWAPKVDAFLARVGLPSKIVYPEYLPVRFPPPTHYAAIDDIDAIPYLREQDRPFYQKFLKRPMSRAFVIDPSGFASSSSGGFDPIGRALGDCQKQSKHCQLYAVDNYVVWTHPTPAPPPTHFAALGDQTAVPYLNEGGRQGYQRFLTLRKPRAFVVAPDGGWSASSRGDDPLVHAVESCSRTHQGCRFYAVDDNVVWPEEGTQTPTPMSDK